MISVWLSLILKIIFIIFKVLLYLYIKIVGLLFLIFNLGAYYEAYRIFSKPAFKVGDGWYTNESIYPPIIYEVGSDTNISDLVYKRYKLQVFNLIYQRVEGGKFNLISFKSVKNMVVLLFYYFIGVSRVLVVTIKILFTIRSESTRNGVLFKLFIHPVDSRKLIRLNGVWIANGPKKKLLGLLGNNIENNNSFILQSNNKKNTIKELSERIHNISNTKYEVALFSDREKSQIPHKVYLEVSCGNNVGLETDYKNSISYKDYNRDVLIRKYTAVKDSTLLTYNIEELRQLRPETNTTMFSQLLGASINGYNNNSISIKYKNGIVVIDEILNDSKNFIQINALKIKPDEFCKIIKEYGIVRDEDLN